jgi:signal transduction histidine kinase/ActR/RegA family two-component response regulator
MGLEESLADGRRRTELLRGAAVGTWCCDLPLGRLTLDEQATTHFQLAAGANVTMVMFYDRVHPEDRARLEAAIESCIAARLPLDAEYRMASPDGSRVTWVRMMGRAAYDASGRAERFDGVSLDVTARKEAEAERERALEEARAARAEAERLSRLKDDFLATLSHELRTPLNAILGWAQILNGGDADGEALAEGLATIERNARVQTQMIEDLLDMNRIVSGRVRLDVQRVDVASLVKAAVASVQPSAEAKGLRVQTVLDPQTGPVSGDPARLQQVIANLLTNAIKFTPRGGRVQVVLERVNSHLEVAVHDTGQGILADVLPTVFDRFGDRDAATTRRLGGLGMGLSLVKRLVELHGGYVQAKSAGENQGSTFVVALPLAAVHGADDGDRQHPRSQLSSSAGAADVDLPRLDGVKVLVVDDEPDARDLLRRVLQQRDATVFLASGARDAIDLVRQQRPDVIVSDIGMPGIDGYEMIRLIRSLPEAQGGKTPAVALTAFARSEDRRRAMMAGFQIHVAKPAEPAELVATVASLAGRTGGSGQREGDAPPEPPVPPAGPLQRP